MQNSLTQEQLPISDCDRLLATKIMHDTFRSCSHSRLPEISELLGESLDLLLAVIELLETRDGHVL